MDAVSKNTEYDEFREALVGAKDNKGNARPSYAVYDVAFDLAGGEGHRWAGINACRGHAKS